VKQVGEEFLLNNEMHEKNEKRALSDPPYDLSWKFAHHITIIPELEFFDGTH